MKKKVLQIWGSERYLHANRLVFGQSARSFQMEGISGIFSLQYGKEFSNLNVICGISDTTTVELNLPAIEKS